MEYFLVINRNKVLLHASTWIYLEHMLSEKDEKNHILYGSIWIGIETKVD